MNQKERYSSGRKNILVALAINAVLFAFKLFAGLTGGSQAMVTDAVHTLSDILATSVVLIGLKFGTRPEDGGHPYGHGKFETMAAAAVTFILISVSLGVFYRGALSIILDRRA